MPRVGAMPRGMCWEAAVAMYAGRCNDNRDYQSINQSLPRHVPQLELGCQPNGRGPSMVGPRPHPYRRDELTGTRQPRIREASHPSRPLAPRHKKFLMVEFL